MHCRVTQPVSPAFFASAGHSRCTSAAVAITANGEPLISQLCSSRFASGLHRIALARSARAWPPRRAQMTVLRLRRPGQAAGAEAERRGDGEPHGAHGDLGQGRLQHGDPRLQGVIGAAGPVAAERQGLGEELGLEQQLGIGPPRGWEGADHRGVAGQFLVDPQRAHAQMDQRVEPAGALQGAGQRIDRRIARPQVRLLVRQDQAPFVRREAGLEVGRRHDARPPSADHRRARLGALGPKHAGLVADGVSRPIAAVNRLWRRSTSPAAASAPAIHRPSSRAGTSSSAGRAPAGAWTTSASATPATAASALRTIGLAGAALPDAAPAPPPRPPAGPARAHRPPAPRTASARSAAPPAPAAPRRPP